MRVDVLHRSRNVSVLDYRCDAGPDEAPADEHHDVFSLSYVRRGSFGYRCRGEAHELVAGSTLIGKAKDTYRCTHDHHLGGDECLSFKFSDALVDSLGAPEAAWSARAVGRFHAAATRAGGKDNGLPGVRADYAPNYHAAFVLDPDANNVEAVCYA
jgi:hypothetical protein